MGFETERKVALGAVIKATKACMEIRAQTGFPEPLLKQDNSPVTLADFFIQTLITTDLASALPDIPVVAEESSSILSSSGGKEFAKKLQQLVPGKTVSQILSLIDRGTHKPKKEEKFWTLDPIDGTRGFLANRQYAIALALIVNGEVVLGILVVPNSHLGDPSPLQITKARVACSLRKRDAEHTSQKFLITDGHGFRYHRFATHLML